MNGIENIIFQSKPYEMCVHFTLYASNLESESCKPNGVRIEKQNTVVVSACIELVAAAILR